MTPRRLLCLLSAAVLASLATATVASATPFGSKAARAAIAAAPAFAPNELNAYAADNWLTVGGGLTDNRYSTLTQINRGNVANLKVAWQSHFGISKKAASVLSEEAAPIAYNGVLYVPDALSNVFAVDGATGQQLWKYTAITTGKPLLAAVRGVAIGDGRVYEGQSDGQVVALDQTTGSLLWRRQVGYSADGYTFSSAPVYYKGMVIEGVSGGDWAARSFALALDAKTGKELWRWYVVPGPGELGAGSWFGTEWMHGGGAIWIYPSIDVQTDQVYLVTGNPIPWNGRGPGNNLWTDSIVALDVTDGQFSWAYQTVHHDIWDYDVTNPPVLFDATVAGQFHHGIAVASKTGWVYILDRNTGQPLLPIPEKKVPQLKGAAARYTNLSPTQPTPVGDPFVNQCTTRKLWPDKAPDGKPYAVGCIFTPYGVSSSGSFVAAAPSAEGGVDWPPSAFNPQTNFLYVCARDGAGNALGAIPHSQQKIIPGQLSVGVTFGAKSKVLKDYGRVVAMDVTTNKVAWSAKWPKPCFSGVSTTAGGLVFAAQDGGQLTALDATTGQALWNSDKMESGPNAPSTTYTANGKQYVAILAGGSGLEGTKPGDSIYAYALP